MTRNRPCDGSESTRVSVCAHVIFEVLTGSTSDRVTSILCMPHFIWENPGLVGHSNFSEVAVNNCDWYCLCRWRVVTSLCDLAVLHIGGRVETRTTHLDLIKNLQGAGISSRTFIANVVPHSGHFVCCTPHFSKSIIVTGCVITNVSIGALIALVRTLRSPLATRTDGGRGS